MAKPIRKSQLEIQGMRKAGLIAASVLREGVKLVEPGLKTEELDRAIGSIIRRHGATSAFFRYRDFPGQCCISVNEAVIHGIGNERRLMFGDLVKLDVGVRVDGFIGDVAMTVACGGCSPSAQRLMDVTSQALRLGIAAAKSGNTLNAIGKAVQDCVESAGYGIVREFCGHGVGRQVHEEPQVPNYVDHHGGTSRLRSGMTIAIEPMVTEGDSDVQILEDRWTVVTRDRKLSAHFEHTVLVGDNGPEVLTVDGLTPLY